MYLSKYPLKFIYLGLLDFSLCYFYGCRDNEWDNGIKNFFLGRTCMSVIILICPIWWRHNFLSHVLCL